MQVYCNDGTESILWTSHSFDNPAFSWSHLTNQSRICSWKIVFFFRDRIHKQTLSGTVRREVMLKYILWENERVSSPKNWNSVINKLLTLMLFQTRKTFVHLRNTNLDNKVGNISCVTQLTQNSIRCLRPANTLQNGTRVMQRRLIVELTFFFFFFAHKKYSCSFIKLRLNPWCHMDYFTDLLT